MATFQRCFRNRDVLCSVVDHIDSSQLCSYYAEHDSTGARSSFVALALTSKELFLEPCLNTLWKHLPSLGPLLNCLYGTYETLGPGEYGPRQSPTRFREPQDLAVKGWSRFDFYAHRIRYLWTDDDDNISEALFFDLATGGRTRPLLRRLRSLMWYHSDRTKFPYLSLFGGPSLEDIVIYPGLQADPWPRDRGALFGTLSTLQVTSAHLKSVKIVRDRLIDLSVIDNELEQEASCLVEALCSLESFACATSLTSPAFRQLASMTALRSLTVHGISDTSFLQSNDKPFFASLEELNISAASLSIVNAFVALLGNRSLRNVAISAASCPDVDMVTAFFHHLDATCDPEALTRFSFHTCPDNDPSNCARLDNSDERTMSHSCMAWLKRYPHLRELSIVSCVITWDDTALDSLARAWPSLRVIEIGTPSTEWTFTARTLMSLARHCPFLSAIALEAYFENSNEPDPTPLAQISSRPTSWFPKLKINIGHLNGDGSECTVAAILKRIFPNVNAVSDRRVEFWIRMEWPQYRSMTEQNYLRLPSDTPFNDLFVPFPWPDDSPYW